MARPTFARIDLDAIMQNVRAVKNIPGVKKICAAVKADAYGHGAPAVAKVMSAAGVDIFAVAMTEEAVELRQAGITEPIILLTTVPEDDIETILRWGITSCITDEKFARRLSQVAKQKGFQATAHINIDTGMHRVGIPHDEATDTILRIAQLPALGITGIFTHFACSEDRVISREQLRLFNGIIANLKSSGYTPPLLHVANSTATLTMPEAYMDCVRPGLILYGMLPPAINKPAVDLRPAMSLHTRVSFCKDVPAGAKLGYGHTYRTWRQSTIVTLPLGYHDGYVRQYSNKGLVLIRGRRAPVVGRVCMDQTLADATDIPGAESGDDVVIYGEQKGRRIRIEEMAADLGRIPYELTCSVGGRVRRKYVLEGEIIGETPMRSFVPRNIVERIQPGATYQKTSQRREVA
ncbi:MAG: alanine racemase [Candidatus Brocadiia bacterium]